MTDNTVWIGAHELTPNDSSAGAKAANTAAIQAPIDYAHANARQVIHLPAGVFYCDPRIYVDPPGNLRNDPANPTVFDFSMHLRGVGGLGNHNNHGTQLKFTDVGQPAVILGTGQGMRASDFAIVGPWGASSRAALPEGGIGLAMAGGNGGMSRALIDNVHVANFREAYTSGYNRDSMCDSVTLQKCSAVGCYRGWHIKQTQNYINSAIDCAFGDNTTHIYSPLGKPANVIGGNYSATVAHRKAFAVTGVSELSPFSDSRHGHGFTNWTMTVTLTAPDQPMADGAYDAFVIKTATFGLVPFELDGYNPGTGVATLRIAPGWLLSHYANRDIEADTAIEAELQAAATLYACETVTPFHGTGIHARGSHVENPGVLTRLLAAESGFTGDRRATLGVFCNYDITHATYATSSEDNKAVFYCQQAFPFIRTTQGGVDLSDSTLSDSLWHPSGVGIEAWEQSGHAISSRNTAFARPNVLTPFQANLNSYESMWPSMSRGTGEWDSTPFLPTGSGNAHYAAGRINHAPFQGFAPARYAMPRLTKAQFDAIIAGPGALGSYPCLHGETTYALVDDDEGAETPMFARSFHRRWSYGQDLAIDWSYRGQTNVVHMSDLSRMFAGLVIILDNGVDGDQMFTVTGVYAQLGYVTVMHRYGAYVLLHGDKGTTYTGAVVKQESYAIKTVSGV